MDEINEQLDIEKMLWTRAKWEHKRKVKRLKLLKKQIKTAERISALAIEKMINVVHTPGTYPITVRSK